MQSDRSAIALQRQEGRVSSSPALSTPPDSPVAFTHSVSSHSQHHGSLGNNPRPPSDGVDFSHDLSHSQQRLAPTPVTATSASAITTTENNKYNKINSNANTKIPTAPVKKPRKKREQPAADANIEDRPKEKKARKPREPRNQQHQQHDGVAKKHPAQKIMVPTPNSDEITLSSNNVTSNSHPHATPALIHRSPDTLRPASSGQHFDPVRSVSIEAGSSASKTMNSTSPGPAIRSPPFRSGSTASATSSIHGLINPIPAASSTTTKNTLPSLSSNSARQTSTTDSIPVSPSRQTNAFNILASAPATTLSTSTTKPATPQRSALSSNGRLTPTRKAEPAVLPPSDAAPDLQDPMAMEIDTPAAANTDTAAMPPAKKTDTSSAPHGATPPSSKSNRQKEVSLPPLPGTSGTGLLSTTSAPPNGAYAVNICLHFDLSGKESLTFSFAREVERKYGRDALHPRRAAHRDRMARMAAATAALEKDSSIAGGSGSAQDGSDLSEMDQDNDQDMDLDSNAEGGPIDGAANGNFDVNGLKNNKGSRKKRRPNKNEYNLDDDFIDDAELAWEEQAAVATGGFFVYSGPLVPEGEKPAVERADGTTKRGRGRGRGGSARGDGNAGTHGNSARGDTAGGGRGSRGGRGGRGGGRGGGNEGSGSRNDQDSPASHPAPTTNGAASGGTGSGTGNGTTRKPRIKKAEKAERTAEKEREKAEKQKLKEIKKEEKAAAKALGKIAAPAPANLAAAAAAAAAKTGSNGSAKSEPAQIQFQSELQFQPQSQAESELQLQNHHQHQHPPGGLLTSLKSVDG